MATEMAFDIVPGVFATQGQAEAAIAALRRLGLTDADLGVAVPNLGQHHLIEGEETPAGTGRSVIEGAIIGAPLGTIAGLGIIEVLVPVAGSFGLGGVLVGLGGGALWGTFFGAFGGLLAQVRRRDGSEHTCTIALGGTDMLVVARAGDLAERVRQSMQAHGARCFFDEVEASDVAPTSAS
jgi:hypothetical protein